jgi:hypothetical protein
MLTPSGHLPEQADPRVDLPCSENSRSVTHLSGPCPAHLVPAPTITNPESSEALAPPRRRSHWGERGTSRAVVIDARGLRGWPERWCGNGATRSPATRRRRWARGARRGSRRRTPAPAEVRARVECVQRCRRTACPRSTTLATPRREPRRSARRDTTSIGARQGLSRRDRLTRARSAAATRRSRRCRSRESAGRRRSASSRPLRRPPRAGRTRARSPHRGS